MPTETCSNCSCLAFFLVDDICSTCYKRKHGEWPERPTVPYDSSHKGTFGRHSSEWEQPDPDPRQLGGLFLFAVWDFSVYVFISKKFATELDIESHRSIIEVYQLKGVNMWLELIPAYGRDYKNQAEVKEAWKRGDDFQVPYGPYCNKADAEREGANVIIRYNKLMKVVGV